MGPMSFAAGFVVGIAFLLIADLILEHRGRR